MSLFRNNDCSRSVFENIDTPILIIDENMDIVMMNDCAKQFFDVSSEENVKFEQLFAITRDDALEYLSGAFGGLETDCYKLIAKKNNAICEISVSTITDKKNHPTNLIVSVCDRTSELNAVEKLKDAKEELEKQLSDTNNQIETITLQTVTMLANFIDSKNEYTVGHSRRVARYAGDIATELGWSKEEVRNIYFVGLLHDVGKIGIPYGLLNKPTMLNSSEYELIKKHTTLGAEILKDIKSNKSIGDGALYHHEHYDGSGYPKGLKGEEIPLVSRVIGIADAFDAMTSNRSYKKGHDLEGALKEIKNGSGSQFDPYLSDVVVRMIEDGTLKLIGEDEEPANKNDFLSESSRLVAKLIGNEIKQSRFEADNDYLTQVWNRGTGERHISEYLKLGDGALAIIDLDNFKKVNDTFGHQTGDYTLKFVADILKLHSKNEFLCRMGGDEFMLFIRDVTTVDEVKNILDSILFTYNSKIEESQALAHTSLSIGVALSVNEGRDYSQLFRCADRALYYVKQNGKKGYSFHKRAELAGFSGDNQLLDIERLAFSIKNNVNYNGAYRVEYRQFMHTHEFIEKYAMRNNQSVQLVLLTIDYEHSVPLSKEEKEEVIGVLERAVALSLRGVDVSTRFSMMQMLLTLVDTTQNSVTMVVRRILQEFYRVYSADKIIIKYETADITMRAS